MINSSTGALITGGLTNIGLATSKKFLNLGIPVVAGSSNAGKPIRKRIEKDLHHLAQINNVSFLSINMDVSDEKSVRSAVRKIETQFGLISILVNSAGVGSSNKEICNLDLKDWQRTLEVNLTGPFLTTRQIWPHMRKAGCGRIINIASTAAHIGSSKYSAFCSSKAGLLGLTRATAVEGAPYSITANSISPSWVETIREGVNTNKLYKEIAKNNLQKRVIQTSEIAEQICWLALKAPVSLTGEDIRITGGELW